MSMTPQAVLAMCRERDIKAVDLRFMDFPGLWQHFTIPVSKLDEEVFEEGLGFDGSSIRGWQAINESDMLLLPQPATAFVDPFTDIPTLCMICNVQDPITREDYTRDPRNVARKAVNYLKSTGVADTCYIGPEAEFFIFDDVRFDQTPNAGYYCLDSDEGQWNRGRDYRAEGMGPNLGYKLRHKEGYFPVPPSDALMNISSTWPSVSAISVSRAPVTAKPSPRYLSNNFSTFSASFLASWARTASKPAFITSCSGVATSRRSVEITISPRRCGSCSSNIGIITSSPASTIRSMRSSRVTRSSSSTVSFA